MAKIPANVQTEVLSGMKLLGRGKVRDSYDLGANLGVKASNRLSIFDVVLPVLVPCKGAVLTAMNVFWRELLGGLCEHDLVAHGIEIDQYLPPELAGDPELQATMTIVKRLNMASFEGVVRGYLTGSAVDSYTENGTVCGHRLPEGLNDGDELPYPFFTPTSKAVVGHDEHVDADVIAKKWGVRFERLALGLYAVARKYALSRGIVLVDTKFEFGFRVDEQATEQLVPLLADEVLTPDSSRYWKYLAWLEAQKKHLVPPSFDKQRVREWGKTVGVNKFDPENEDDLAKVAALIVPAEVIAKTTAIYRYIFWRLTGLKLERFQQLKMGIDVEVPSPQVAVVMGSEHDKDQLIHGLTLLREAKCLHSVNVCSCHRNPDQLRGFVKDTKADIIIAAAGKAAALPGVIKGWVDHFHKGAIPVIGVALSGKDESDDLAAELSIECLPGQPVELDADGEVFFGEGGFLEACSWAIDAEFLPNVNASTPAKFNIPI